VDREGVDAVSPFTFIRLGIEPGFSLLPKRMNTPRAQAMTMAICLQESDLQHRRQIGGPARGYAQFETGGVRGVLTHGASADHAVAVCRQLDIDPTIAAVHAAMEWCDPLTVALTRLLLWTDPAPSPDQHADGEAWRLYIRCWRPGKPHPAKWSGCFGVAHDLVGEKK
jgi:hypothetical protein